MASCGEMLVKTGPSLAWPRRARRGEHILLPWPGLAGQARTGQARKKCCPGVDESGLAPIPSPLSQAPASQLSTPCAPSNLHLLIPSVPSLHSTLSHSPSFIPSLGQGRNTAEADIVINGANDVLPIPNSEKPSCYELLLGFHNPLLPQWAQYVEEIFEYAGFLIPVLQHSVPFQLYLPCRMELHLYRN